MEKLLIQDKSKNLNVEKCFKCHPSGDHIQCHRTFFYEGIF